VVRVSTPAATTTIGVPTGVATGSRVALAVAERSGGEPPRAFRVGLLLSLGQGEGVDGGKRRDRHDGCVLWEVRGPLTHGGREREESLVEGRVASEDQSRTALGMTEVLRARIRAVQHLA
jgi:hypothetical protein